MSKISDLMDQLPEDATLEAIHVGVCQEVGSQNWSPYMRTQMHSVSRGQLTIEAIFTSSPSRLDAELRACLYAEGMQRALGAGSELVHIVEPLNDGSN